MHFQVSLPTAELNEHGLDAQAAKDNVSDFMAEDICPDSNLGSFVTTTIESQAQELLLENYSKNLACQQEYPALRELHNRCVAILASLWHAGATEDPTGTATSGSSEAMFLGILALKRRWQAQTKLTDQHRMTPNVIIGSHSHVAVSRGLQTCDVEKRVVEVGEATGYRFDVAQLDDLIDNATIGVILVLGNTYTGHYDPVEDVSDALLQHELRTGQHVPIHVDAASGGLVAPFQGSPASRWDFSNPLVVSINVSGHKFGMAPASAGWILWRDALYLPDQMMYRSAYLSGESNSCTMSYSMPSTGVIIQYYNFTRLGRRGYELAIKGAMGRAQRLSILLESTGWFQCLSCVHLTVDSSARDCLPVVAFSVSGEIRNYFPLLTEEALSEGLRAHGYSVPFCSMPGAKDPRNMLRVVVRPATTEDVLDSMFDKLCELVRYRIGQNGQSKVS